MGKLSIGSWNRVWEGFGLGEYVGGSVFNLIFGEDKEGFLEGVIFKLRFEGWVGVC